VSSKRSRRAAGRKSGLTRNHAIVAFGIALFLILAGTGTASALWSSLTSATTTVSAATMGISQSGFSSVAVEYNASTTSDLAPVTVTNSGTIASTFSLLMRGPSTSTIATSATVQTAVITSAAGCTSSASFGTRYNWSTLPALTGTLAAGASTMYCVRSSLTTAQVTSTAGQSMDVTLTLTSASTNSGDNWTANASATATQSSKDTVAPSAPGTPALSAITATSMTITWAASTDNVAVTAYDLYRGGALLKSGVTSPYTDSTLTRSTSYTYTIKARDAAGNTSATSAAATATTTGIDPSKWYKVKSSQNSNLCVTSDGGAYNYAALRLATCGTYADTSWQFKAATGSNVRVVSQYDANFGWALPVNGGGEGKLWNYSDPTNGQWTMKAVGTSGTLFQFVNVGTGTCLSPQKAVADQVILVAATCAATTSSTTSGLQIFSVTVAP
jgi:hypothetical protein